jgi:hypothetical protein
VRKKYIQRINPNLGQIQSAPNKVLVKKKTLRPKHTVNRNPTPPKWRKKNRDLGSPGDSDESDSGGEGSEDGSPGDSEDGYREYGDGGEGRKNSKKRGKRNPDNTSKNHIYMYPHNVKGLKINITK